MFLISKDDSSTIRSVDTGTLLHFQVLNGDKTPFDFEEKSNETRIGIGTMGGKLINLTPVEETSDGHVRFRFDEENLLPSGRYWLEIQIETDDGLVVAPSGAQTIINVTKSMNEMGEYVSLITIEQFERRIDDAVELAEDTYESLFTRWLNPVPTVSDRDSTYPSPENGDTVRVTDDQTTYRYVDGEGWVMTDDYSAAIADIVQLFTEVDEPWEVE